ncbi:MAG: TolC family protein [Gallionella sp.]|nr:TolC family protein [Gallionella sp.]
MNKIQLFKQSILLLVLSGGFACAAELDMPDLPPASNVASALDNHVMVLNAASNLKLEQANQRKWNSGNYEFNLRAGSARRSVSSTGQKLGEWDVALERPLRLPNKVTLDQEIGMANVAHADFALGDARHEAGRLLLKLWFDWEREQAQVNLWLNQIDLYQKQVDTVTKRIKAGDAAKMELNQAQVMVTQAIVSSQQAQLRAQLASNALRREFPTIQLEDDLSPTTPEAIVNDYAYWQARILDDNHELGMAIEHNHVQQLLAQRSHADQIPDPTVGARFSSEVGGSEKVAGVYVSVPLSFGQRNAIAEIATQQANIAADQLAFVHRRLESDVNSAYRQAVNSYTNWQKAREAAIAMRNNALLVSKAYSLGEGSLTDSLAARRYALDASLAETLAQLDANESRYRLLLDSHQLWAVDEHDHKQ